MGVEEGDLVIDSKDIKLQVNNLCEENGFKVSGWGYRHQQCLALFACLTIAYSMRACIGIAMVSMIVENYNEDNKNTTSCSVISNINATNDEDDFKVHGVLSALMLVPPYPKFKWSKTIQDAVISSFFWGYMVTQLPAGQLTYKFGSKYLLTGAMLINCVISIFLPLGAYYGGWITIVIFRILQGLSQACIMPGMHTLFGKWAPIQERGRLTAFAYGGNALGTVLGIPITGYIASSSLGWPGIFRFYGLLSGICGIAIWIWVSDSPATHPKISEAEKIYIEEGLGQRENVQKKKMKVPWKKILSCPGMYAIIVAHIGNSWTTVTLFSEIPAFMDKVMKIEIKANGLLTALPFLIMWLSNFFFSWFADMLVTKKYFKISHARKLLNSLGYVIPAIGLVVLAFFHNKNIYVVEGLLVFICTFKSAAQSGFQVNHIDVSPNFAGVMMSISNFVSNAVGSLAPMLAAYILTDVTSEYLWRQVFLVSAGFYFFANLIYVIFGTGEVAAWNEPPEVDSYKEDDKESQPMIIKMEKK